MRDFRPSARLEIRWCQHPSGWPRTDRPAPAPRSRRRSSSDTATVRSALAHAARSARRIFAPLDLEERPAPRPMLERGEPAPDHVFDVVLEEHQRNPRWTAECSGRRRGNPPRRCRPLRRQRAPAPDLVPRATRHFQRSTGNDDSQERASATANDARAEPRRHERNRNDSRQCGNRRTRPSGSSSGPCVVSTVTSCRRDRQDSISRLRMRPPAVDGQRPPIFTQRMRIGPSVPRTREP